MICAIVGTKECAFPVDIDKRQLVGDLKDAIKAKNSDIQCPARSLQLFPAKIVEGKWLASSSDDVIKLKKGEKTHHVVELMKEDQKLQGEDYIADFFEGMEDPVGRQIHVLVVVPEQFTAVGNERKRQKVDEDALDAWINTIKNEQVTVLPLTCEDLKKYLQRPLRIKIPIYERYYRVIFSNHDIGNCARAFDKLFESEPRDKVGDKNIRIVGKFY
ncbi:hypothetical protein KXD40_009599 [Peronospora effusa]|nr:hypothetical protein KXD40_009599 [Peronospora effusa]